MLYATRGRMPVRTLENKIGFALPHLSAAGNQSKENVCVKNCIDLAVQLELLDVLSQGDDGNATEHHAQKETNKQKPRKTQKGHGK